MRKKLAKNLEKLIYSQGIPVTRLAKKIGVSRVCLYTWMRTGNMSVSRVEKLAKFFGVKEEELIR